MTKVRESTDRLVWGIREELAGDDSIGGVTGHGQHGNSLCHKAIRLVRKVLVELHLVLFSMKEVDLNLSIRTGCFKEYSLELSGIAGTTAMPSGSDTVFVSSTARAMDKGVP